MLVLFIPTEFAIQINKEQHEDTKTSALPEGCFISVSLQFNFYVSI
jgi:hypothetical protein